MTRAMRLQIIGLALVAIWPPLASAGHNDALDKLRLCVRTKASAARAAGVQTAGDALQYFGRECLSSPAGQIPLFKLFLGDQPATDIAEAAEAVPPGSFRHIILDEWAASGGAESKQ